jgi:uncharacterized protein (TIGR03663 family)
MQKKHLYYLAVLLIIGLAAFFRFYELAQRPFHHDESLHAFYSYLFESKGFYRYNPMLHGPFLFNTNALIYLLLGDTQWTSRLLPALAGVFLVVLCLGLKPAIGRMGALAAAALIAVSPAFVYYSRFLRNDIYITCFWTGILVSLLRWRETKNPAWWYPAAGFLALSFCTKENTYFALFSFLSFGMGWLCLKLFWTKSLRWKDIVNFLKTYWMPLATSFFIFWAIYIPLMTVYFQYPEDWNGFATGLKYWAQQHHLNRLGAPWWYYFVFLGLYEFLPCLLTLAACLRLFKDKVTDLFPWFLFWWFISSLGLYSLAGEKVPWLLLHIVLPMIFLAGWWLQKAYKERKYWIGLIILPVLFLSLHTLWNANFRYSAYDPQQTGKTWHTEPISFVQTTYDVERMLKEIQNPQPSQSLGVGEGILVTGEACWPLCWYLRNEKEVYFAEGISFGNRAFRYVLTNGENYFTDRVFLEGFYEPKAYQLRCWWPSRPWPKQFPLGEALKLFYQSWDINSFSRFYLQREVDTPPGCTEIILWTRK